MNTKLLLPHIFKRVGIILCPLGMILWVLVQMNILLSNLPHISRVFVLIISASSFVLGLFFTVFAKERIEDEFIFQKRLETFQLSSIIQTVFVLLGFFMIGFSKEPMSIENQLFYFIGCLFFFYLFYILRFNYVIHKKYDL